MVVLSTRVAKALDTARCPVVHRDEVVAPDEEVDVTGRETARPLLVVDPVQHEIEVLRIGLDLRELECAARILDRERMKMKEVGEQGEVTVGRFWKIDPEFDRGGRV